MTEPGKPRVLIVDDDVLIGNALGRVMRMLEYEVRCVHSGQAALREAARFRPEIVLLDIDLPDVNGYDVARQLRELAAERPYIAAMTARSSGEHLVYMFAAGIDHYVQKPFGLNHLRDLLDGVNASICGRSAALERREHH